MQEDYEDEDYNDEDIEGEEDLILEESPQRKKDALIDLINHQLAYIQQLTYIPNDLYDAIIDDKIRCATKCFKVISAAQDRLLDKIKEM